MQKLSALALCLGLMLSLPGDTHAGKAPSTLSVKITSDEMLSGVALNAAAGSRTITINVRRSWAKLRLGVAYTYSAATSVTLTPSCLYEASGTAYALSTRNCTSGACELAPQTDVETGTASWTREIEYDVRGCHQFKVVFSGGGSPGAGDLITTEAVAVTGI